MPKVRPQDSESLTDFKLLSFDCFGTLIDWESGMYAALSPLLARLPPSSPYKSDKAAILHEFNKIEVPLIASHPDMPYSLALERSYVSLAHELQRPVPDGSHEAEEFGDSIGDWTPFPDTIKALQELKKRYKLVILSNVDNASFRKTREVQFKGVEFDAVYTAEDIGSYKPDLRNFEYLLKHCEEELGVKKDQILHVAHGLLPDHVPAKKMGMRSAWIERGTEREAGERLVAEGRAAFTWSFVTMGEMAEEVDKEVREKGL